MFKNLKKIVLSLAVILATESLQAILLNPFSAGEALPVTFDRANFILNEARDFNAIPQIHQNDARFMFNFIRGWEVQGLPRALKNCHGMLAAVGIVIVFLISHGMTELASEIIVRLRKINPEKNTAGLKGFCKDIYKRLVWLEKGSLTSKVGAGKLVGKVALTYTICKALNLTKVFCQTFKS